MFTDRDWRKKTRREGEEGIGCGGEQREWSNGKYLSRVERDWKEMVWGLLCSTVMRRSGGGW